MPGFTPNSCAAKASGATETGDHLVEYQQDAVLGAYLAQFLQVALGWRNHTSGTGDGFDDDGRDARGIVQADQPLQFPGQFSAVLG